MKQVQKDKQIILKHDLLVEVTKKFESIDEHRFLNSCLEGTYQRELLASEKYYAVSVTNYAKKYNVSIGKAFTELTDLITRYKETTLKIPLDDNTVWHTSIVYDFITDKATNTIQIKFNKKIIPLISGDMEKGRYCLYDGRLDVIPSNRRYLMGELIQRNMWRIDKHGFFILQVKDIRESINLLPTEYMDFKDLNRCVIQASIKDVKKQLDIHIKAKGSVKKGVKFERDTTSL